MLGIINRIKTILTGSIQAIDQWVLKLIHTTYSYVNELFAQARQAANEVYREFRQFDHTITKYAEQVYVFAHWIVTKYVPSVIAWARRELIGVRNDIAGVLRYAERWVIRIANDLASAIRNITSWVIKHIYTPLLKDFTSAWHWITHEGALAYHLITHPEKLAAILAKYVWASWLDLFKRDGKQISRWLLKSMMHEVGPLADALETFISNLLS